MNFPFRPFLFLSCLFLVASCSFRPITKSKDLIYDGKNLKLDVYAPKKTEQAKEVLIFVHGGNWNSGKKSIYKFFGKGMARKGIVTVVINYRLSPEVQYREMTADVAASVKWVKENIATYGGDPSKIFISGHSAGGHLAALVATDNKYFNSLKLSKPLKGAILIDAFGLDIYDYLSLNQYKADTMYYSTFTKDPSNWRKGSPTHFVNADMPPLLILVGEKTFTGITRDNYNFWVEAKKFQPALRLSTIKNKKHVGMILQFYNPWNKNYDKIIRFMRDPKAIEAVDIQF